MATQGGIVRHARKFIQVAAVGPPQPCSHVMQLRDLAPGESGVVAFHKALQAVQAQVVCTPLEQRHPDGYPQRPAHHGQVTIEKLVLQILGPGGHDHPASRQQRRNQIGKGLAGPGAGLDDQCVAAVQGAGNGLGHVLLLRPDHKPVETNGQRAARPQCRGRCRDFRFQAEGGLRPFGYSGFRVPALGKFRVSGFEFRVSGFWTGIGGIRGIKPWIFSTHGG